MFENAFWDLMGQSGPVIMVVYGALVVMSVTSWMLIFYKLYQLARARRRLSAGEASFEAARDLDAAMSACGTDADSCPDRVAREGMEEVERMRGVGASAGDAGMLLENVRRALIQQSEAETDRLYGSLGYLATWANVSPLLGLFGTVWGIMSAFTSFTSALLNSGGVFVLLSLPALDYRIAWGVARVAVFLFWNYPLNRDWVFVGPVTAAGAAAADDPPATEPTEENGAVAGGAVDG